MAKPAIRIAFVVTILALIPGWIAHCQMPNASVACFQGIKDEMTSSEVLTHVEKHGFKFSSFSTPGIFVCDNSVERTSIVLVVFRDRVIQKRLEGFDSIAQRNMRRVG